MEGRTDRSVEVPCQRTMCLVAISGYEVPGEVAHPGQGHNSNGLGHDVVAVKEEHEEIPADALEDREVEECEQHTAPSAPACNIFLVRACLGSRSIRTPEFPIVPRKKTFVRVICNTTFTTLLTPPQRPALPLEAQPRPPQHQPGHGRQGHSHRQRTSERKERSGAQHDLRSSFSWRNPAEHYIEKNGLLLTGHLQSTMHRRSLCLRVKAGRNAANVWPPVAHAGTRSN